MLNKIFLIVLWIFPLSAFAHHSFLSIYDQDSIVTIEGVVVGVIRDGMPLH